MTFKEKVLTLVRRIPRGRLSTYREIARHLGSPGSARAVGNALNKNDRLLEIPCHRVVRSDGRAGGYARGARAKAVILRAEGITVDKGKIADFHSIIYRF